MCIIKFLQNTKIYTFVQNSYQLHEIEYKKINVSFLSEMPLNKSELLMPVGGCEWNIHFSLMEIFWLTTLFA